MSDTKPGTVTSSLRTAPPVRSDASMRTTSHPASARALAATNPLGPEPMTTASATVTVGHPDDVSRQNTTCDLHGRTSTTVDDGACGRCSTSLVTRASAGETEDGTPKATS